MRYLIEPNSEIHRNSNPNQKSTEIRTQFKNPQYPLSLQGLYPRYASSTLSFSPFRLSYLVYKPTDFREQVRDQPYDGQVDREQVRDQPYDGQDERILTTADACAYTYLFFYKEKKKKTKKEKEKKNEERVYDSGQKKKYLIFASNINYASLLQHLTPYVL